MYKKYFGYNGGMKTNTHPILSLHEAAQLWEERTANNAKQLSQHIQAHNNRLHEESSHTR